MMKTSNIFILALLNFLIQLIPVYCGSDELLESWNKINTNYANDINQSFKIYSKIKDEQRALAELRIIVERHLRTKNAELLVNAISSNNISMPANNLKEILEELNNNYDNKMVEAIFAEAIDEIILNSELPALPELLWSSIYQENNKQLFELMLRAQLQLYNNFGQRQHTDEREFLLNFANKLYKIKQQGLYNTVDFSLKLKVQNIVEQLPYNLKYLYFMPYFCLLNVKYSNYIYTAIDAKVDPLTRYIWLWRDSRSMDDTGYIKAEIEELNANNGNKLNVLLKGIKYKMYYYMMPGTMKVAGWDSTDIPVNNIWGIEFLDDDRVVFSQNDHLMCAVENHDNDRRNVGGRKIGEVSSISPECQWRLGQCLFR